eukprot:CFRG2385T1
MKFMSIAMVMGIVIGSCAGAEKTSQGNSGPSLEALQAIDNGITEMDKFKEQLFPGSDKVIYEVKLKDDEDTFFQWSAQAIAKWRYDNRADPMVDERVLIKKNGKYVPVTEGLVAEDVVYYLASFASQTLTHSEEEGGPGVIDLLKQAIKVVSEGQETDPNVYYNTHCIRVAQRELAKLAQGQGRVKKWTVGIIEKRDVDTTKALETMDPEDTVRLMYIQFDDHHENDPLSVIPAQPIYEIVFRLRGNKSPELLLAWVVDEDHNRIMDVTQMLQDIKKDPQATLAHSAWWETWFGTCSFYWATVKVGLTSIWAKPSILMDTFKHYWQSLPQGNVDNVEL